MCRVFRPDVVVPEPLLQVNTAAHLSVSGAWVCLITLMVSGLMNVGETHCSRLVEDMTLTQTHFPALHDKGDRRTDRFEPRYDPRGGPDPRDYRGAPPMRGGDYGRPAPYDRYDRDYDYDR